MSSVTTTPINDDLNKVIATAVNARVEAAVLEALSGDATLGAMVIAALQQPVEIKNPNTYKTSHVPFLNHLLQESIRQATKDAVARVLIDEQALIEEEVRKHIRRQAPEIAAKMAGQLADVAAKGYGVTVSLRLPGE